MARIWSEQQAVVFDWYRNPTGRNLVQRARAGCAKTTTNIEGINQAPEQRIALLCFAKPNQVDAAAKLTNQNAEALTSHALGFRSVKRYWEKIFVDKTGSRVRDLVDQVVGQSAPDPIKKLVGTLVTKTRELAPFAKTGDEIFDIALQFDCEPDNGWKADGFDLEYVCGRAVEAVELAATKRPAKGIDYADMLFLPLRNGWLRPIYDLVVIDEAQDWTLTQLELARRSCSGRFAIVGDDRQSIYAFRGADSDSLDRLKRELDAVELPLTTTYRCGKVIVEAAKRLVPDFVAAPTNDEGVITETSIGQLSSRVNGGDFILSRTNAPLVGIALGLIRQGRRAKIEGRDIGAGLRAIVNKLATGPAKNSVPKFLEKLSHWKEREVERAEKAQLESKVQLVLDQFDTLIALTDGVAGIPELFTRLENLFDDKVADQPAVIVCSSVHRAKGREADRVFVLRDTLNPPVPCAHCKKRPSRGSCPCGRYEPDPRQQREEQNIEYVAITRAKNELVWVAGK